MKEEIMRSTSTISFLIASIAMPSLVLAGFAQTSVDLSGLQSWDIDGSILNESRSFQLAEPGPIVDFGYIILGINYDITIQTMNGSTLSDLNIRFGNSDGSFHGSWPDTFRPGEGAPFGGTQRFTGSFSTDIHLNEDGLFLVELFESINDLPGADAILLEGSTMSFNVFIPSPSSSAVLGFGALAVSTRRRRS
ncbi:MAG: hypothetical protein CMJ35_03240 [Phycisphaerae bacterium]|nr:hypothetical protein [Phycisphaerae bacterium]HCT44879.1 hypothetical protein [Phycisphaerales bacterium]|tara:strand:+ start:787 stop:1365 length:579 start_codon:yes stop_codon:yes gene_type:complete